MEYGTRLARHTDPDTSHAAAASDSLRRCTLKRELLSVYWQHTREGGPPITNREASNLVDGGVVIEGYWKRCSELRKAGLIERCGTGFDEVTGKRVMACAITREGYAALRQVDRLAYYG